jgi:hypothetical protein
MRNTLKQSSEDDWTDLRKKHQQAIFEFVAASPSKRCALKKYNLPETRYLLILGAVQYLLKAGHLLKVIDDYQLYPGLSYRDMAANAAAAYADLFSDSANYWPFGEPAPFDWKLFSPSEWF